MADIKEIRFVEAPADPNKGFRIGHALSVFQNNVTFKVTGYKLGNYSVEKKDGTVEQTKYADSSQSIVLKTSVDEDLPLNRLLHKKDILYDAHGDARVEYACSFKGDLMRHMLALGRREDDSAMLKGTIEQVAAHALAFFNGKDLICKEISGFAKDEKGKLQNRISPFVQFCWKE